MLRWNASWLRMSCNCIVVEFRFWTRVEFLCSSSDNRVFILSRSDSRPAALVFHLFRRRSNFADLASSSWIRDSIAWTVSFWSCEYCWYSELQWFSSSFQCWTSFFASDNCDSSFWMSASLSVTVFLVSVKVDLRCFSSVDMLSIFVVNVCFSCVCSSFLQIRNTRSNIDKRW